jgi:hypothetical protein
MEQVFGLEFLECGSEKGCRRKHTGNRVTRWKNLFERNLGDLRCFTKRNYLEEFEMGNF